MRFEVELPDWCERRHIYVLAGVELAAYQKVGGPVMVKTGRCSMCGKCCERLGCAYLKADGEKRVCGLGLNRPFSCCVSVSSLEGCTETFDECQGS